MPVLTERSVEVPWALKNAVAPILDVGCAESSYLNDLPDPVDGIDVRNCEWDPPLRCFYQGDIRTVSLPVKYRTVLAISTIEHIGLAHEPYGTTADEVDTGDWGAVDGCMRALEPGGKLLMSVPYGKKFENRGWYRVYDRTALTVLLHGYDWTFEYQFDSSWAVGGVALVTVTA